MIAQDRPTAERGRRELILLAVAALLGTPVRHAGAQAEVTPAQPTAWRGWMFGRAGLASNTPLSGGTGGGGLSFSGSLGVAASHGVVLGMVRLTGSQAVFGPSVHDRALLAGARTRDDQRFVAAAVGIGEATPFESRFIGAQLGDSTRAVFAYDLSAHRAYRVAGLQLAISGVVGPTKTSYAALTFGVALGWFGD